MAERTEMSRVIKAPARRIYEAWLDPEEHALMTGASTSAGENGAYTAWDGYIEGRTISSEPFTRIEQTWRTTEFPDGAPDSKLVIELTEVDGGTEVKLVHTNIPDGQAGDYDKGWHDFYFEPMEKYFSSPREKLREGVEALEEAAERAGDAIEGAVEQAGEAIETAAKSAAKNVGKAFDRTKKQAKRQAEKAVKKGKQVQKKVAAQARSLGKKVRALVKGKKAATPKKPVAKKKAAPVKMKAKAKKKSKR